MGNRVLWPKKQTFDRIEQIQKEKKRNKMKFMKVEGLGLKVDNPE